ncbi:hypothetical protein ACFPT7_14695 [Acidicapsa dinghuensis]|uniref:Uncharacterized protein n=1 Tax=Acidicapsa dinghuensis TaxID=2218256 RepID=A0ABW1EIB0_9BACT|nr:hypothetical protein [Acidicapsa dinghuensis]
MSRIRTVARNLLAAVVRRAPGISEEWAEAMLRELDYIPGEWESLFWSLGSAAAILRQSACALRAWLLKLPAPQEKSMNSTTRKTLGVLTGMGLALALAFAAFGLVVFTNLLVPSLHLDRIEWTHVLFIVILPEIIFIAAAVRLWRTRTPVAAGILITAVALATHVLMHFAHR